MFRPVCLFCVSKMILKKLKFFFSFLQINIFFNVIDDFDVLISKIILKK
jgi:hypothetical protein